MIETNNGCERLSGAGCRRAVGGVGVIAIATDSADSQRAIARARQRGDGGATTGIHPRQAGEATPAERGPDAADPRVQRVQELTHKRLVLGSIGETPADTQQ